MDLVWLIDMIEIQWVVDFYFILEITFQPFFWNMILKLILKICQLKLIYERESGSYNPHKNTILSHLSWLNLVCSKYNKVDDNLIFIGDFNVEWWMISIWQIFVLWTILKVWIKNQHVTKSTRIQHVLV